VDLYLIRHAEATPLGEGGVTEDADRPLTPKGEAEAKTVASGLHRKGITLSAIVTSPLLRAHQTADAMLRNLPEPAPELKVCEELAFGGKRRKLNRFIKDLGLDKVVLVGHQPDLGEFAAWLIGSKKAQIDIAKAGIACITCDSKPGQGKGTLLWLVGPEWFEE
jgi:phosphohistidine phosphatase